MPCPLPRNLPHLGIDPASLMSPALASGLLHTSEAGSRAGLCCSWLHGGKSEMTITSPAFTFSGATLQAGFFTSWATRWRTSGRPKTGRDPDLPALQTPLRSSGAAMLRDPPQGKRNVRPPRSHRPRHTRLNPPVTAAQAVRYNSRPGNEERKTTSTETGYLYSGKEGRLSV